MTSNHTRATDAQIYRRLLTYVTPYWGAFLLSIAGFILYSMSNVGFMQLVAYIVDSLSGKDPLVDSRVEPFLRNLFGEGDSLNRNVIPIAIVLIAVARGFGTFVGNYFITYVGTNLVHNLRCELFDQLLRLPSRFFDQNAMGHLVAKVTFHVTQVTGAATDAVRVIIREGFTVIGYLAFLFYLNWKLTLIFLAVAPLIALLVDYAGKRFRRISERIQDSMGDVTHVASEAVQGYRVVRTFGGADYERRRFEAVSHDNRRQSMKMVVTSSIATPVVQIVVATALAGLVWLVLDPVLLADMSEGMVVAFIGTGGLLAKPIRQLSEVNSTVQKGLAAAEDIFHLFDEAPEPDNGTRTLGRAAGKVEFRHVSFRYDDEDDNGPLVLKDISFVVQPGETIALVGRSGSGKSTLASLIPRFYTADIGQILVDDVPIDEITLESLREQISIVTQDVTLFNASVARNIAYGTLFEAPASRIQEAATRAYAWDFISELESGLETIVGDDGVLLSGGQRQRIAIARAFLKDAPILILDEATSALDSESERYIQRALDAVVEGRTTFVIAHRLSTIEKADRIFVIDAGRIVEQGTHAELLARKGAYANLHNHQSPDAEAPLRPEQIRPADFKPVPVTEEKGWQWLSDDFNPLLQAWYSTAGWTALLTPLALIYTAVARFRRRRLTARQWLPPVPLVIVGNINVGGTGKSPLVLWLANQLVLKGMRPGIVSRGYGGRAAAYPLEVTALTDPTQSGDEPVMIARRTGCPVVVDPDRVAAVQYLLAEHECDIVLCDDGLQHYALGRHVEIVVLDGSRGLGNGRCLPAGPLREPPARLAEADFVVVNGGGDGSSLLPVAGIGMRLEPVAFVNVSSGERRALDDASFGGTVHAVAGIGNPERFFRTLRALGLNLLEHSFEDHHRFKLAELTFGDTLAVVMTEKDAIKVRQLRPELLHQNFWYLEVDAHLPAQFLNDLQNRLCVYQKGNSQDASR
ncbi:MAG: lipid A export permease/ATP-binding protein MsbA [Pseudomonadota bacterium]